MLSFIQTNRETEAVSPVFYVGIGILLVVVIIMVLWRRQHRRFND